MACWRERGSWGQEAAAWRAPGEGCLSVLCLPSAGHPQSHLSTDRGSRGAQGQLNPFRQRQGCRSVTKPCLLLSTSLQKDLKSKVPSAPTATAHSWGGKQAPCQEPGFAGSRAFYRSSHGSCHNPAGHWGQVPLCLQITAPHGSFEVVWAETLASGGC